MAEERGDGLLLFGGEFAWMCFRRRWNELFVAALLIEVIVVEVVPVEAIVVERVVSHGRSLPEAVRRWALGMGCWERPLLDIIVNQGVLTG
jgi:hypothetical protein